MTTSEKRTTTQGETSPLSYDWHPFNDVHPDPDLAYVDPDEDPRPKDERPVETPEDQCETCGQGRDALVHQVDESGGPTREAQAAADRSDTSF